MGSIALAQPVTHSMVTSTAVNAIRSDQIMPPF